MNDLGRIASGITTYEFPNDTGTYNIGYVSGWLETNIGELNGLLHEEFEIDSTALILSSLVYKLHKAIDISLVMPSLTSDPILTKTSAPDSLDRYLAAL